MIMTNDMIIIKEIAETLAHSVSDIDLVILYGSFARGLETDLSDYDIMVICDNKKVTCKFISFVFFLIFIFIF